ncbi:MAG: prolipoprotein diacylglyceryl transferase [Melioribacteraceae bacterium]|nr:MAG: prolipoprotein diacylglyceryl transferase [Melioribacteraceae bacterium]
MLLEIVWSVEPTIFELGPFSVRWYGLLFALGFIIGFQIFTKFFEWEKRNKDDLNDLLWYMIIGTVVGARLGHCFFYDAAYYLANPLEIFMIWKGGLASHGATIGILVSLYYYSKKKKDQPYIWVLDRMVIPTALGGAFIRLGNFFNSEIIGEKTDVAWGVVFTRVDDFTRHPAQLYESIAYLVVFFILMVLYIKRREILKPGFILGLFLVLVFGFRFFVEFVKENQKGFEDGLALNMGQILSIPAVLAGIYFMFLYQKKKNEGNKKDER